MIMEWCEKNDFYAALARHNNPAESSCMPLFSAFVIGSDIKAERQLMHINFSSVWLLLNAVRAIETRWAVQLNWDATFGFCSANIDMNALDFCSFGGANNPVCFSYIPRQSKGEKLYAVIYFGMQKAVLSLIKANTDKDCEFSTCLKLLLGRPHVLKWTICGHTALLTSVFDPEVQVPGNLVAETPALRKKCSKIRGTAGPRKAWLLKQIAKQKKKSVSKIGYVDAPVPPVPDAPAAAPTAALPDGGGTATPPAPSPPPSPSPPLNPAPPPVKDIPGAAAVAVGGKRNPSHGTYSGSES
jgi:hypothetical protein